MLVRRLSVGAFCAILVIGFLSPHIAVAADDKQLTRSKGVVGYAKDLNSKFTPTFGTVNLDDNAFAITQAKAAAVLRLKDSSEIDLGEKTNVQVGAFNDPASSTPTMIFLKNGALHFTIRHPQGGRSNYNFTTATSQIAVRGTEAFLIAGPQGTQLVCVTCAAGDITVTTGTQVITVLSGQTLTVIGTNPATSSMSIAKSSTVNNPAVNQFTPGSPPGTIPPLDPTGSLSGGAGGAGGGAAGGLSTGALVGGGLAAGAVAAIITSNKGGPGPLPPLPILPSPSPLPTIVPAPGPLSVTLNFPQTAFLAFPVSFALSASQVNASAGTSITASATPANVLTCCTIQQTFAGTTLSAMLSGSIQGPGTGQITVNAGAATFTGGVQFYGAVIANLPSLSFSAVNGPAQTIIVSQAGPTTGFTVGTPQCAAGALINVSQSNGGNQVMISIVAAAAPTVQSTPACTIAITGQGRGANTLTIPINIYTTSLNISGARRKPI